MSELALACAEGPTTVPLKIPPLLTIEHVAGVDGALRGVRKFEWAGRGSSCDVGKQSIGAEFDGTLTDVGSSASTTSHWRPNSLTFCTCPSWLWFAWTLEVAGATTMMCGSMFAPGRSSGVKATPTWWSSGEKRGRKNKAFLQQKKKGGRVFSPLSVFAHRRLAGRARQGSSHRRAFVHWH